MPKSIKYFEKLSVPQIQQQVLEILNYSGNSTERDKYGVISLLSNCINILSEYTNQEFIKSLETSTECIDYNSKFLRSITNLKANDKSSFIIAPVISNNHLLSTIIYKKDDCYECILVNKGSRIFGKDDLHHIYESYTIESGNIGNIISLLGMNIKQESTKKIYDIFSANATKKARLLEFISTEQKEHNCYYKEIEAVLKYAYSNAYNNYENKKVKVSNKQIEVKVPKWPIDTYQMQARLISNIKELANAQDVIKFADKILYVYQRNKTFRSIMKQGPTKSYSDMKSIFYNVFSNYGQYDLVTCMQLVDVYTMKRGILFFKNLLKENNIEMPPSMYKAEVAKIHDFGGYLAACFLKGEKDVIVFINRYYPFVSNQVKLRVSRNLQIKGLEKLKQNDWKNALTLYTTAISLDPYNVFAYAGRIVVYTSMGKFEEAKRDFENISKIANGDIDFKILYAVSLITYGKPNEALKIYDDILKLDKDNINVMRKRAKLLEELGKERETLNQYEKILENFPDDKVANQRKNEIRKRIQEKEMEGENDKKRLRTKGM